MGSHDTDAPDNRLVETSLRGRERLAAAQDTRSDVPGSRRPVGRVTSVAALLGLAILLVRITVHAGQPLSNSDTWFHLRIGHELWGPWSLSHPGALSSFATTPWIPTQWSTEMLAAKLEDWFGLPGVAWLFGLVYVLFILIVYANSRHRADPLVSVVVTGLVVIAASGQMSARPQMISLILLVVTVEAWLRSGEDGRPRWWLVPMTWVWATAHGLWSAGLLVGLVAALGVSADRRLDKAGVARLLAVPALSGVAACLTPIGPRLVLSQLAVGSRASLIGEWGPTSFRTTAALAAGVLVGTTVVLWARRDRVPWLHISLLVIAAGWVALVQRMIPFGAVLVAPLLSLALAEVMPSRVDAVASRRRQHAFVGAVAVGCLVVLALVVPRTAQRPGGVPQDFAERLARLPAGTAVLVEDGTGAWIEWRFHDLNPVVDGMLDAYPVDYMRAFADFKYVRPGWKAFVRHSGAPVAVLVKGSPLSAAMQDRLHWVAVQRDQRWVYLRAPQ